MTRESVHLSDKYIILEDGVYDMTRFQEVHPGGDVVMLFTGQVRIGLKWPLVTNLWPAPTQQRGSTNACLGSLLLLAPSTPVFAKRYCHGSDFVAGCQRSASALKAH